MSEAGAVINNNAFFSDNAKMKICAGGAAVAITSALALTAFLVISNGDPMNCMRDQIGTFTSTGLIVAGGAISAVAYRSLSREDGEENVDARSRAASEGSVIKGNIFDPLSDSDSDSDGGAIDPNNPPLEFRCKD